MVESKKHILTSKGMQALEDELQDLKVVKRKEIAQKIKEAREQGDLSENAEYDAAKDEQRSIEAKIEELEKIIRNAEVIDESTFDKDTVSIGSSVKFYDEEFDEELEYRIVGSTESDIMKGLISNESPLGKALVGAKVGQEIEVESADGISRYKVLEISRVDM
ncbi:MAG: transcription elongation factor GreA [Clostridiales bacterium]|uniref:Transcription elongation factor GreA n=1 Tax=Candidatus Anaerobutyricum stercoripullorum TaxID=2838456 RepID=A0A9D1X592_9FIRM|nr:transcription elongation factor GreA [Clostridiales bacterium]HIX73097.1 transcription elongation factor GreA [Candidatus Anaerobutyricum stercoripullorum]